jgi:putative photosynthetic complex assembly protein
MTDFTHQQFPRGALMGAAVIVSATLVLTAAVRLSGVDISSFPLAKATQARSLRFTDRPNGAVAVYDASNNQAIEELAPGTNGFARAIMRNFARERRSYGIGPEAPFRLTASADGRLILEDQATGRRIDLEAFGPTNSGVFASMLQPPLSVGPKHD